MTRGVNINLIFEEASRDIFSLLFPSEQIDDKRSQVNMKRRQQSMGACKPQLQMLLGYNGKGRITPPEGVISGLQGGQRTTEAHAADEENDFARRAI